MEFSNLIPHPPWWQSEECITFWLMTSLQLFPFLFVPKFIALGKIQPKILWRFVLLWGASLVEVQSLFFFIRIGPMSFLLDATPDPFKPAAYFVIYVLVLSLIDAASLAIGALLTRRSIAYFVLINFCLVLLNIPSHLIWRPILPGQITDWLHLTPGDYLHIGDLMHIIGNHN